MRTQQNDQMHVHCGNFKTECESWPKALHTYRNKDCTTVIRDQIEQWYYEKPDTLNSHKQDKVTSTRKYFEHICPVEADSKEMYCSCVAPFERRFLLTQRQDRMQLQVLNQSYLLSTSTKRILLVYVETKFSLSPSNWFSKPRVLLS